ncbi:c-type cytochrome [Halobacteriovorax marinus]|nr:hypothetical protein [Halobacteriovorax marinus]
MKSKLMVFTSIFIALLLIYLLSPTQKFTKKNIEVNSITFREYRDVIKRNCSSCHDYYLEMSEEQWVESNLVTPSSPAQSRVYSAIRGSNVGGDEDMPPKKSISKDDLETVKTWIHDLKKYSNKFSISKKEHLEIKFSKNKELTPIEVFERCFIQIAGKRPSRRDPLYKKVKQDQLKPSKACLLALQESSFLAENRNISKDTSQSIRDNFHRFFTSWYSNYSYYRAGATFLTHDIHPRDSSALLMSYVLWKNKPFKDILLTEGTLQAIRKSNSKNNTHLFFESPLEIREFEQYRYGDTKKKGLSRNWSPKWLPRGEIVDIVKKESFQKTPWYVNRDMNVFLFKSPLTLDKDLVGANTTQAYILNNMGRDPGEINNGGLVIPRTWSRKVLNDFLCRDLPAVRIEDTVKYVQRDSKIKFRSKSSCMQCHTTIDPMAGVIRNSQAVYTSSAGDSSIHIRYFKVSEPKSNNLLTDVDRKFHLRPPTGRFIYRNNNGNLIDQEFNNIHELNKIIISSDDFYQCATKKVLYYMTGIDINLEDNIFNKDLDKRSTYLLSVLKDLSEKFKKSGDMKLLIYDIINTDLYQQEDFGGLR